MMVGVACSFHQLEIRIMNAPDILTMNPALFALAGFAGWTILLLLTVANLRMANFFTVCAHRPIPRPYDIYSHSRRLGTRHVFLCTGFINGLVCHTTRVLINGSIKTHGLLT